jgi:serine protease Do
MNTTKRQIMPIAKPLCLMAVLVMAILIPLACSSTSAPTYTVTPPADFTAAVEKILPAVVTIEVDLGAGQIASGTGWIVDANGHIATNNHVIEGGLKTLVTLNDGRQFTATAVKGNTDQDLAVVKIDVQNLPAATIGDSSLLKMGQPVVAVGNSLDLGIRATAGIVSRLDVTVTYQQTNLTLYHNIETDAVLNPGNSGGVLINISGEVVGITNASLEGPNTDVDGFDYAIAINEAMPIINGLVSSMP